MAIPSASGTEVIKYNTVTAMSTTVVDLIPSPLANHIYTVISIIWAETANAAGHFYMRTFTASAHNAGENWMIRQQALPAYGTFTWNERFSFSGALYLTSNTVSSANFDVHVTYIDQNWV